MRHMRPTRDCNECIHVIDIREDMCGYDEIACECDECNFERCPWLEEVVE